MNEDNSWDADVVSSLVQNGGIPNLQLFVIYGVLSVINPLRESLKYSVETVTQYYGNDN